MKSRMTGCGPEPESKPVPEPGPEPEELEFPLAGDEPMIGGIELHAGIMQEGANQQIHFTYLPIVRDRAVPETMTEYNSILEDLCTKIITAFPDNGYARFHTAIRKSGGADRCWYWIRITLRDDEKGVTHDRITDWIDPVLLRADPHVAHRAKKAKAILKRVMKECLGDEEGEA